jgi:hypothetical protein
MYNFIVGGYLPGTDIQLSFQASVAVITILFGIAGIIWIEYKQRIVSRSINSLRQPLHASQLHQRG